MNAEIPQINLCAMATGNLHYDSGADWTPKANRISMAGAQQPVFAGYNQTALQDRIREVLGNKKETELMATDTRRIVRVIIADPNENVPLDKAILYSGAEKFTDLTDQELFFEIGITEILGKHNEARVKMIDKKATEKANGKDIFLEAARIRDLKMQIVVIAQF